MIGDSMERVPLLWHDGQISMACEKKKVFLIISLTTLLLMSYVIHVKASTKVTHIHNI